jgi:predicted RNase H-like HicB family nuclease
LRGLETMKKIVVEERNGEYVAHIETGEGIWGYGKSKAAAIGDMIVAHRRHFDIVIEYKEG